MFCGALHRCASPILGSGNRLDFWSLPLPDRPVFGDGIFQQQTGSKQMRKINLFNRNTNLPSYRRKPVSGGIIENRHTAEARCLGQAKRGLAPQEIFHCETMKNINVCDAGAHIRSHWIPAFAGMTAKICGMTAIIIAALFAVPAMATQDEIDQKTVTSKYYVDQGLATKQDTITIDKVVFIKNPKTGENTYVPAIVATNAAGTALNGNTIGVLDRGSIADTGYSLDDGFSTNNNSLNMDNFVPTVRAVAEALSNIKSSKQDILSGAAGSVVTYTGTEGSVGSTAVSSAATYNGTTLTNGNDIANIAAVETAVAAVETAKQDKMTCAGYVPGHENDIDYCWLYGDIQVAAAAAPQCTQENEACDPKKPNCCSGLSCYKSDTNPGVYQCM